MNFSLLFLATLFLFTGCNLASGGKEYERVNIEREGDVHLYSCEKDFSSESIKIQAQKADNYLFNKIEDESTNMMNYIIHDIDDKNSSTEEGWFDEVRVFFLIAKKTFEFQSNVKDSAEEIVEKFGCVYIDSIDEE